MIKKFITIITFTMAIFSCSSNDIKQYQGQGPKLDIFEYFNGQLEAFGTLQDRSGNVTRRFTVTMTGKKEGNDKLILEEFFVFDDGEKQERTWTLNKIDSNNFTATASDVVGQATGQQYGHAMNMKYILNIPYKNSDLNVNINDWMYLIDDKSLINVSKIKKFGFIVGKLSIGFKKLK